jgi:ribonuclease P protein component
MPGHRDESFGRKNRLSKATDFKRVFSKGKRNTTRFFVIYCLPNHLSFPRLGIQVRAKIGTAVQRNYIKRIVRDTFRKRKGDLREPLDMIFIAEKPLTELKSAELETEFWNALGRYLR